MHYKIFVNMSDKIDNGKNSTGTDMKSNETGKQLAVRVDDELIAAIDRRRLDLAKESGLIPTRSDIVRLALEKFLGIKTGKK